MDKHYQDIHYTNSHTRDEFVIRCVQIVYIDTDEDFINIYFRTKDDQSVRMLVVPKLRGSKLIID